MNHDSETTPPNGSAPDALVGDTLTVDQIRHVTGKFYLSQERPVTWKVLAPMAGVFAAALASMCWTIANRPFGLFEHAYAQDQAAIETRFKAEKERRESLEDSVSELRKDMVDQRGDTRETKSDVKQIKAAFELYLQNVKQPRAAAKLKHADGGAPDAD